ncbi:MAG: tRNA (adenosine(37)-N6)-dimethylallyltransferase MiaA [Deltaproteobacteria bacterium]|nr:tRNA (adenosine(37)-N6)-dimethylallyltransferase MiaA [Deltaproteobacteria bacterium]
MEGIKAVVIAGPTASGKTALAIELARIFDGEIISADSMQVYKRMNIGAGKPSKEQRDAVAHHLIDIAEPAEDYTAADFMRDADRTIKDIHNRGKKVFVAGGTGLYIRALLHGIIDSPAGDSALREALSAEAAERGAGWVHERLKSLDPEAAASIHPNNLRRVLRALEVTLLLKRPSSKLKKEHAFLENRYDALLIGLEMGRQALYAAIDERVDGMLAKGLVDETRGLIDAGYSTNLKPMNGLGYKEAAGFLRGEYSLAEAARLIKRNTRRYAKRQRTWFKKEPGIIWLSPTDRETIQALVAKHFGLIS